MPPFGGPGLRRAYFRPVDSKRSAYRDADAPPPQAYSLRLRPEPPTAVRGYGRLIFALWAQNARPTGALPSASLRTANGGPGLRPAYFRPVGSKRAAFRSCAPFGFAPNRQRRFGASAGLFSPCGLKTRGLQELRSLRLRPEPPTAVRGYGRLIFALRAQNARPSGASLPSRAYTPLLWIAAESPPAHKRCAGGLGVLGATRGPPCPRRKGAWRAFRPARRRASAGGCR